MTPSPTSRSDASSRRRASGSSLLSLAFDGTSLAAAELHRTNGSVEIRRALELSLSLDLLTTEPELVGREIRKQLEAAGIKERRCTVCLPQSWALSLIAAVPEGLSESDQEDFLQLEAERGFASGSDSLVIGRTLAGPSGAGGSPRFANLVGIPRQHIQRLEAVLRAAHLRPISFSLATVALRPSGATAADGTLTLVPGERSVHLLIHALGNILGLRSIEDAFEVEGGAHQLQADLVSRELRITLGQLPPEIAETIGSLRIAGNGEKAKELTETLTPRLAPLGLTVVPTAHYPAGELPLGVPAGTTVSGAVSFGVRQLAGEVPPLEFLPPKVSRWQEFSQKYASRKLVPVGAIAAILALAVVAAFGVQQARLAYWQSKWNAIRTPVTELEATQKNIRQFRPWFDDSFRSLSVLRRLSEAFPEDGTVSAKTLEIREASGVTCTGTARDNQALLRTVDRLRGSREVNAVKIDQIRGRTPMQFTLNFQWSDRGTP